MNSPGEELEPPVVSQESLLGQPAEEPLGLPAEGPLGLPAEGPLGLPAEEPLGQPAAAPLEQPAASLEHPACRECGETQGWIDGRCRACGAREGAPLPAASQPAKDGEGPQTLWQRALAVLFTPAHAFRHHSASWGWAKPWLLVAAIGMLVGAFTLTRVDMAAIQHQQFERSLDQMSPKQRKAMEQPSAKEAMDKWFRMGAFFMKVGQIGGPPFLGLVGILFWGGVVFLLTRFVAPQTPSDLLRCVSLAAWVSVVDALGYLAKGVGVLFGAAMPQTGAGALVDPVTHPLLGAALGRIDPLTFYFYGLLAVGMIYSLKIPRKRAIAACLGIYALVSLLLLALVGVGVAARGLGGGQ